MSDWLALAARAAGYFVQATSVPGVAQRTGATIYYMEFFPRSDAPEGREPRRGSGFGQDGKRPYEERQRVPGDYDAQISIHGGVARHGLEHLAATDRGIIMMRNMIRRGIRAVHNGEELDYPILKNGAAVPTYSHDRVVSGIAAASTPEEDKGLLREVARNVVAGTIEAGSAEA